MGKLRTVADIVKNRLFRLRSPVFMTVAVTGRCNIQCHYCFGDYYNNRARPLPAEFYLKFLHEAQALGVREITWSGGEPLLRKELLQIVETSAALGIINRINTNGSLVGDKVLPLLRRMNCVNVSLDGPKAVHDANRGADTFEPTFQAVRYCQEKNIPVVVTMVMTRHTFDHLDQVIRFFTDLGVPVNTTNLFHASDYASLPHGASLFPSDEQTRAMLDRFIQALAQGFPGTFSASSLELARDWPFGYEVSEVYDAAPQGLSLTRCHISDIYAFMDYDGALYPCTNLPGRFPALSVPEVGFRQAWEAMATNRRCILCHHPSYNVMTELYELKPRTYLGLSKSLLKFKKK